MFAEPKTVSELAALERVKVPTMSRLVAAEEGEGLVRRRPHRADARVVETVREAAEVLERVLGQPAGSGR